MKTRWWFSLTLLALYLATFHLWLAMERTGIIASGLVATAIMSGLLVQALRTRYFLNFWDGFWHATVILDVLLEATLIRWHSGYSFYLCALAFVLVVGGYRAWLFRRQRR